MSFLALISMSLLLPLLHTITIFDHVWCKKAVCHHMYQAWQGQTLMSRRRSNMLKCHARQHQDPTLSPQWDGQRKVLTQPKWTSYGLLIEDYCKYNAIYNIPLYYYNKEDMGPKKIGFLGLMLHITMPNTTRREEQKDLWGHYEQSGGISRRQWQHL